jgi:protein-ribulosamine 3-kinase
VREFAAVSRSLGEATGSRFEPAPLRRVGGGCINECFEWTSASGPRFVKLAPPERLGTFEAEADGLRALAECGAIRIPGVFAVGRSAECAFLVLEWLERAATTERSEEQLGRQLALQHRSSADAFGWRRDNAIGLTPQPNSWSASWLEFLRERRLRFQLGLAERNGFGDLRERGQRLLDALSQLLSGHEPKPALLHGDLWGGNWFASRDGEPVIFDPAVYFGDREADLAMTHLFGGFGSRFYAAYEAVWPLAPGHELRRDLYNLYHLLNHANLFGEGYARQAAVIIDRLLASADGAPG